MPPKVPYNIGNGGTWVPNENQQHLDHQLVAHLYVILSTSIVDLLPALLELLFANRGIDMQVHENVCESFALHFPLPIQIQQGVLYAHPQSLLQFPMSHTRRGFLHHSADRLAQTTVLREVDITRRPQAPLWL